METNSFKFGEFLLDAKEKVLLCNGKPISITPKAFQLLQILVENHGHLVGRNELINKIWADSSVEEGNLTFTVRLLRKALSDSKQNPQFIETVPKRGYRFIAEVKEFFPANEDKISPPASKTFHSPIDFNERKAKNLYFPLAISAVFLASAIALGIWLVRSKNSNLPILSAPFSSEKLSTNGKVVHAVISPDGKNVVYTNGVKEKQSIWLRQLETGNNLEIIPPSNDKYAGLAFSPDGNFLYFVRQSKGNTTPTILYRVSIFGGIPQEISKETEGWLSLSPDGKQISFVRCQYRDDENCSLWIADSAAGKNERKVVLRPRPLRIADNQISPDGKSIAFAVGQSENQANEFSLMKVDLESGAENELSKEKFFNIKSLAWLPDQSGLLITTRKNTERNFRIWQVSTATGEAVPLTNDSETYSALDLDKEAANLVSTQVKLDSRIRLVNAEKAALSRNLVNASSVSFASDGKIYFSSIMSGNGEIWSVNADGSNQRQLTNNPANETTIIVSPDNNSVFFSSNRTGAVQVWQMNPDGSNQKQITQKEGGFPLFVSPDGEWVYYHHGITRTLWRVSLKDGGEQLILNKAKNNFAISPDGLQVAFAERQGAERILTVASLTDGKTVKTFHLANKKDLVPEIVWMSDGKNLAYISANIEYENNILWLQPLAEEKPRQIATLDDEEMNEILSLAVSPDGKTFAIVQGGWLHDAVLIKGLK